MYRHIAATGRASETGICDLYAYFFKPFFVKIDNFFAHIVLKKDAISRIRQNEVLFYDIKELKSIGIDIPEKAVHLTREQFCQFHSEGLLFLRHQDAPIGI